MLHYTPANITLYVPKTDTYLQEISLTAIQCDQERKYTVLESGREAEEYQGRPGVEVISPLRDGQIAYFDAAVPMFQKFLRQALGKPGLFKPTVVVCSTKERNQVEEIAMIDTILQAGAKKVELCAKPLAQALHDPLLKDYKLMIEIQE